MKNDKMLILGWVDALNEPLPTGHLWANEPLSPLLYSLYTHDCVSSHSSTSIIKFADDTVVLGLINNDDEAAYLEEVERLTSLTFYSLFIFFTYIYALVWCYFYIIFILCTVH